MLAKLKITVNKQNTTELYRCKAYKVIPPHAALYGSTNFNIIWNRINTSK